MHIFLKGSVIGLITGMPLGPVGALCMRTTLANGASFGIAAGLGSCVADSIYASVAALGITIIARVIFKYQHYFHLFGGLILIILGIHTILTKKENKKELSDSKTMIKSFLTTFLVAIANPATIFSFIVVFSGYGSKNIGHGIAARTVLVSGVFCGSLIWWIILVVFAGRFHKNITPKSLLIVNRILGSAVVFSGLILILSLTNYKKYTLPYMHSELFKKILHIKLHKYFS